MQAILVAILATAGSQLAPVPTGDELAKAEKLVRDVFADQQRAADTPKEKAELGRKMLQTAATSESADRYVLLRQARELAAAGGDSALGIRAVEEAIANFAPPKKQDLKQWASEGHRLWNDAYGRKPTEKLRLQLAAAECYLRALDGLEGFQGAAVRRRVKELGWKEFPIEFNFDESKEGWATVHDIRGLKVQDGCLHGRIVAGDPYLERHRVHVDARRCKSLEIRMSVTAGSIAQIFWSTAQSPKLAGDKYLNFPIVADGQFHTYRIDVSKHKLWTGEIIKLRVDPGEWEHRTLRSESFSIDFIRGNSR